MGIRRKKYLVEPSLQLKIGGLLSLIAVFGAINICVLVYVHLEKVVKVVGLSGLPPATIASQLHDMNLMLILKLCSTVTAMVILLVAAGSWLTHRIAGPLFKLRRILREYLDGKELEPIYFRKDDEFRDVLEMITEVLQKKKAK